MVVRAHFLVETFFDAYSLKKCASSVVVYCGSSVGEKRKKESRHTPCYCTACKACFHPECTTKVVMYPCKAGPKHSLATFALKYM